MVASNSPSAPLVVIIGATGNQGGSVLNHLCKSDKPYRLRAITRDATKPNAEALRKKGAEVVSADLEHKESIEKAFAGADIVFAVTQYWTHMSKDKEVREGKLLVDIAKAAGVKNFIWSGLENATKVSGGKLKHVAHFDGKAEVTEYGRASGMPFTVVLPGCYNENFTGMWAPQKQNDGSYVVGLPCAPNTIFSFITTGRDYGLYVREAIESPKFGPGSEVLASGEEIPISKVAELISKGTGKNVKFAQVPDETFLKSMPEPMATDIFEMIKFFEGYGYFGGKDIAKSNTDLAEPPQTFEQFVKESNWSKILA